MTTHTEQYNKFPYPERDPEDEKKRLVKTSLDDVKNIKEVTGLQLNKDSKILVIGCGTGDQTTYLSTQLQNTDILAIDLSEASIAIAKKRLENRNLSNVEFRCMDLFKLELEGEFDYINACGILHHLPDPLEGFKKVRQLLKPGGVAGIMVYGKYGRTGITQMQVALKLLLKDESDVHEQIRITKDLLAGLIPTNWFCRGKDLVAAMQRDIDIYDILLNPSEKAYSLPEIWKEIDDADLEFVDFESAKTRLLLKPEMYISDREILRKLNNLTEEEKMVFTEVYAGVKTKHLFYVRRKNV